MFHRVTEAAFLAQLVGRAIRLRRIDWLVTVGRQPIVSRLRFRLGEAGERVPSFAFDVCRHVLVRREAGGAPRTAMR